VSDKVNLVGQIQLLLPLACPARSVWSASRLAGALIENCKLKIENCKLWLDSARDRKRLRPSSERQLVGAISLKSAIFNFQFSIFNSARFTSHLHVLRFAQCCALILSVPLATLAQPARPPSEPGLAVTFKSQPGSALDMATTPNVWLFVEEGHSPSPFLPAGPFSAVWEGTLSAELRSEFFFRAELRGSVKLEINGATALEATGAGGSSPLSKPIALKKGPNTLKATFTSPAKGDAFLRLTWTENGTNTSPIPFPALNHAPSVELERYAQLHFGRELFLEYRCSKCHTVDSGDASVPELKMDAPSFEGIGARRNPDWMARWVLDPKSLHPTAHMPRLLSGPKAKEDAEAIAAGLSSLKQEPPAHPQATGDKDAPKNLFEKFRCDACHDAPDAKEPDPKKLSLTHLAEKFSPGSLAEFLRMPEANFAWTRMPNFNLSPAEATSFANVLTTAGIPHDSTIQRSSDPTIQAEGIKLIQSSGCLNCHSLKLDNRFSAPRIIDLVPTKWEQGCLAAEPVPNSKAPRFSFSAAERLALKAFGETDRLSLTRHVPAEFAERQTRLLNCNGCHGQIELVPPLEILGGKLKPEWVARFLAGEIPYKPRAEKHPRGEPWVEARMPAFKSRAKWLADGLAAQHGVAPHTLSEPPIDSTVAKIGQKLVGKEGGFSCISCHAIGKVEAAEVFESEGPNLSHAAERLLPAYYRRWLRNPPAIDPLTKMPVYFEEGKSPLTDVFEGDAEKQIEALWQFLRMEGEVR